MAVELTRAKSGLRAWKCQCDCGGLAVVTTGSLNSGNSKSCGCTNAERFRQQNLERKILGNHPCTKHGHSSERTHVIWRMLVNRCSNPNATNYKDYGGRGITVCPEWLDYEKFLSDMGPAPEGLTIERLDNDKGYSKDNCVWATAQQQGRNRRSSVMLTYQGRTQSMVAWAEELAISYSAVKQRYRAGKSIEEILKK